MPRNSGAAALAIEPIRQHALFVMQFLEKLKNKLSGPAPLHVEVTGGPEYCRERARAWVHAYAAGGAAYAFVPIPVPGSTTAGLIALETTMVHAISRIYGQSLDVKDAAAMVSGLQVAGNALKHLAREAVGWIPGVGWLVRGAIAAAAIEAIGNAVIKIFENQHPDRRCA